MPSKKRILHVTPFDDLIVVGISTTLKDYKLAWHLNQVMRLDLKKMPGFSQQENSEYEYSFYYFDQGENDNVFNLLQNQNQGIRLINFPVPVDFLFIIRNKLSSTQLEKIISTIRATSEVHHAFEIDIDKNKQLDPLLEQLEFHEFNLIREQNIRLAPSRKKEL